MSYKSDDEFCCLRCGLPRHAHVGGELRCARPPRRRRNSDKLCVPRGDGCYLRNERWRSRVSFSMNLVQAAFLDRMMLALTRGADCGVLVRSKEFADLKRIIGSAKTRTQFRNRVDLEKKAV